MTATRIFIALAVFAATPAVAQVQTWQPRPGEPAVDPLRYEADQHRLEMARLRLQADQREAFARQLELEARLSRGRLETARQPEPVLPPTWRTLQSPDQERDLRRSAEKRHRVTANEVGQIDAWLDRRRD